MDRPQDIGGVSGQYRHQPAVFHRLVDAEIGGVAQPDAGQQHAENRIAVAAAEIAADGQPLDAAVGFLERPFVQAFRAVEQQAVVLRQILGRLRRAVFFQIARGGADDAAMFAQLSCDECFIA